MELVEIREKARSLAGCVLGDGNGYCGVVVGEYSVYVDARDRGRVNIYFGPRSGPLHEAARIARRTVYHYWPAAGREDWEYLEVRLVAVNTVYRAVAAGLGLARDLYMAVLDTARLGCRHPRLLPAIVYRGMVFTYTLYCAEVGDRELEVWTDFLDSIGAGEAVSLSADNLWRAVRLYRPLVSCRRLALSLETGIDAAPVLGVHLAGDTPVYVLCMRGKRYGLVLGQDDAETVLADYAGLPRPAAELAAEKISMLTAVLADMLS